MSPGQKRGTCGHIMAIFDGHLKCAQCRNKGVGEDNYVLKKDCPICKAFTPEQLQQLSTPTYRERKNKEKKLVSSSPTPTLVDPSHVSVLGKVEGEKANVKPETTSAGNKKKRSDSPRPSPRSSKKKPSSRPSSEDLKNRDDKWAERYARLEAMLLSISFAVPVEPVVKPAEVMTSQKPFFILVLAPVNWLSLQGVPVPALVRPPVMLFHPEEMRSSRMPPSLLGLPVWGRPPSLLRLPVRGRPPSLLRLPAQVLRFCLLVPVMLPSVLTRP